MEDAITLVKKMNSEDNFETSSKYNALIKSPEVIGKKNVKNTVSELS